MSASPATRRPLDFGLMFFAASEDALSELRYDLIIEAARFADTHGLSSIWVPERHFTEFGYLYPNPAVLHAALGRETHRVRLRAGSVVIPIHDPLRIAEEWAMADNLSGGRVDVSVAPGWNPNDFAFFPERYADRRERMYAGIETVQRLWRGERLSVRNGLGQPVDVRIYPPPVQPELPMWLTAAGSHETFVRAGELGLNVLTHLLDHDIEDIAERVVLYREARRVAGHDPDAGQVTLMLHTFLGADLDEVRELVRAPYTTWLKSNAGLLRGLAANRNEAFDPAALSPEDTARFADFLFERFFSSRSLMGTPQSCLPLVQRLHAVGVTEIACLLDFGPRAELILAHLPWIEQLQRLHAAEPAESAPDAAGLVVRARTWLAARAAPASTPEPNSLEAVRARCTTDFPVDEFYANMGRFGAQFGRRFRGIERLWRRDGEALAHVRLVDELAAGAHPFEAHPAFLDACLQVFGAALPAGLADSGAGSLYLPTSLGEFRRHAPLPACLFSHARLRSSAALDAPAFEGELRFFDEQGRLLAEIHAFRLQRTSLDGPEAEAEKQAGWFYELAWSACEPSPAAEAARPGGTWLVLADESGAGVHVARALAAGGARVRLARPGPRAAHGGGDWSLDPCSRTDLAWLLDEVLAGSGCDGIVHLWSLDAGPLETAEALQRAQERTLGSLLPLVSELAARGLSVPVWLVTRGAQRVAPGDVPKPAQALTWGLGKTLASEHANLWGGLVDLDPGGDALADAQMLCAWLAAGRREPRLALRAGRAYGARLVRHAPAVPAAAAPPLAGGTHLVTGGLGGLGLAVARWLVARGARQLVLVGRTGLPPREAWDGLDPASPSAHRVSAVRALEAAGARVHVAALDVSEPAQVAALADELRAAGLAPVSGIMHAAGVGRAEKIVDTTLATARDVLGPKVAGTLNLERTFGTEARHFVAFSSATHQLGLLGQGVAAYSAANAFMDSFAHARRAGGRAALSVCFGPWAEVGLAAQSGNDQRLLGLGVRGVRPDEGVEAIGYFMGTDLAEAWAIHVDWPALLRADSDLGRDPLVAALARSSGAVVESDRERAEREALLAALAQAAPRARIKLLTGHIQDLTLAIMRLENRDAVDWRRGLFELGLDSLMALELKNRLQTCLGIPIASTLAFNFPTVDAIAEHLAEQLFPERSGAPSEPADVQLEARLAAAAAHVAELDEAALESLLERKLETL